MGLPTFSLEKEKVASYFLFEKRAGASTCTFTAFGLIASRAAP